MQLVVLVAKTSDMHGLETLWAEHLQHAGSDSWQGNLLQLRLFLNHIPVCTQLHCYCYLDALPQSSTLLVLQDILQQLQERKQTMPKGVN